MTFFDLNIPYTESPKHPHSTSQKSTRLKLTIKALELGYTGIAYNRTITGLMSEHDKCSISLFPLSSILKMSDSVLNSVKLHRGLLNVPMNVLFRQYTRLTVVVDSLSQGSALNSGNPVLKSYDVVAVRPLRQECFDLACKTYEVDIIAIDFSENRFRLKQSLIKAAIERGVCFEISYSGLVLDAQLRRQMISNAKLLVGWTRGKNIIFSSGAPSVTELRGPYDVANLACLLGFSMERARASVSKTCRSLVENALRKKKFFKEAIRVELISSAEQTNGFDDWLKWDPISSGEGDLQLDDMAKSFAASGKESKTVKAIDFASIIDELPSHGLHIKDMVSETKSEPYGSNRDVPAATKAEKSTAVNNVPIHFKFHDPPVNSQTSVAESLEKGHLLNCGNCDISSENEVLEALATVEGGESCDMIVEDETKIPNESNVCLPCPEAGEQNMQAEVHEAEYDENLSDIKVSATICSGLPTAEILLSVKDNPSALQDEEANNCFSNTPICLPTISSNEVAVEQSKGNRVVSFFDTFLHEGEHVKDEADLSVTPVSSSFPLSGVSMNEDILEEQLTLVSKDGSVAPSSTLVTSRSLDELQINGANTIVHEPLEDDTSMEVQVEFQDQSQTNQSNVHESSSERAGRKQGNSCRSVSFPFKRLLKPSHFKKSGKFKAKSTILSLSDL